MRYMEIASQLKTDLLKEPKYGDPLNSERVLAKKYGVSRDTVRKALEVLNQENLISKKNRRGSFPLPPIINRDLQRIHSVSEDFEPLHLDYSVEVLNLSIIEILPLELFDFMLEKKFHKIERRILLTGIPTIYEEHYLPYRLFPDFSIQSAKDIYMFVEKEKGYKIKISNQDISVRTPHETVLKALDIPITNLLFVSSQSYLDNGELFQLTTQFFHPNYNFKVQISR